jgi:uncharacterized membrane protein YedE/YeeE
MEYIRTIQSSSRALTMEHFTPLPALVGGLLIGLAAALLFNLQGRIAGISGIFSVALSALLRRTWAEAGWRWAFLTGLVLAPLVLRTGTGEGALDVWLPAAPHPTGQLLAAGLLVGFGTALGSGCTSGHGVCGLARLSRRSLLATALFMAVAALTVFVRRHLLMAGF